MLENCELRTIKKWAQAGDTNCLLLLFWCLVKGDNTTKDEVKAMEYLEQFLHHPPQECYPSMVYLQETLGDFVEELYPEDVEMFEYCFYLYFYAMMLHEQNRMNEAALWMKKTADLVAQHLKSNEDYITQRVFEYNIETGRYFEKEGLQAHFNPLRYQTFFLDWELKKLIKSTPANCN